MTTGNADAQSQVGSASSKAVSSPQAVSTQAGNASPQPGRTTGNAGIQSQEGSAPSQIVSSQKVSSPQAGSTSSPNN